MARGEITGTPLARLLSIWSMNMCVNESQLESASGFQYGASKSATWVQFIYYLFIACAVLRACV